MTSVPKTLPDGSERTQNVIDFLQAFVDKTGISQGFVDSSDHPYTCTCAQCAEWWRTIGPDEDGLYGPFGKTLPESADNA